MLALVVAEPVGFAVCDSRSGAPLARTDDLARANDLAVFLNSAYPEGVPAPAVDSLIHEIVMRRAGGHEQVCLETAWLLYGLGRAWPTYLPTGPGWDHIYEGVSRERR